MKTITSGIATPAVLPERQPADTVNMVACTVLCASLAFAQDILAAPASQAAFINSIGMQFVAIPAGSFLMGSGADDKEAFANEKPQHRVTISRPFYMGKYEVTQAQWEAVMGSSPYTLARSNPFLGLPGMEARIRKPDNPATVSWNDAQEFVQRLNRKEGQARYRLPTEAEWEYATRAGTTTRYSFGDDRAELGRFAWYGENFQSGSSHKIGTKAPNPWGLYDVHGNVWEWVQDRYDAGYYASSPATDPQGPASGNGHVVRGGSWHETSTSWRSAMRKEYDADYRGISIGLRLVLEMKQ